LKGSSWEERTQLYLAFDQGYLTKAKFDEVEDFVLEISRLSSKLISCLARAGIWDKQIKTRRICFEP
jgi:hypothetical protein